jgi:hypothetical protein
MAIETVPMDDKELFNAAMADEPTQEAVTTEAPVEERSAPTEQVIEGKTDHPTDPNRYVDGTWKPKAGEGQSTEVATEAKSTQSPDRDGWVPTGVHRELREDRDSYRRQADEASRQAGAMQQQLAAMRQQMEALQKPKQEPVDFYVDPPAAFKQQLTPYEERLAKLEGDLRMNSSRSLAVARHGWDAVAEVEKAVADAMRANDPSLHALQAQLRVTDDPVGAAMQWHSSTKLMKETGGNITAYRDKILADAMKDPTFQAKVIEAARGQTAPGSRPNIQLPPSLNKTAGSGGGTTPELNAEDMSDRALFQHAVRR